MTTTEQSAPLPESAVTWTVRMGGPGERGEPLPETPSFCPCGAPAMFGQVWTTEWFDRHGLVSHWTVTRLCADHKARSGRRDSDTT